MSWTIIDGNEAVAYGAIRAGCLFFAGYPITPATTILAKMLELLPAHGGVCLQGEDEIASIGFCLGASMAGQKSMTATSGPGISLYSEQISFAIGSEIPVVIVNVQRLGPSTGSATRGADGDIQFMRWGNSGGLPVIVLAPADIHDCYYLTIQAFNLAERFRCPVFLASNKELGLTRESIDLDTIEVGPLVNRAIYSGSKAAYLPFDADRDVPPFLPIGGDIPVRQTSSTHGRDGYITNDRNEIAHGRNRLKVKLEDNVMDFTFLEYINNEHAESIIVTYGVTSRAARQAACLPGVDCSLLILKTLWPVPEEPIRDILKDYRKVIVIEMNLGQYCHEIARLAPEKTISFLGQMDGCLITPGQIAEVLPRE